MSNSNPRASTDVVRRLYAAIEAGRSGEELRSHFADDARTVTHPNALVPAGRTDDLAAMLAASAQGAGLLRRQAYDLRSVVEVDDLVVTRLHWTGEVAVDPGPLTAGQRLTAEIAQFVRVTDGRVAEIETYDCYRPLS